MRPATAMGADGIRVDPEEQAPRSSFENCTLRPASASSPPSSSRSRSRPSGSSSTSSYVDGTTVLFAGWSDVKPPTPKCNLAHGTYDLAEFAYVLSFDLYGDYYYGYHSEQIPTDANKGNGYNTLRLRRARRWTLRSTSSGRRSTRPSQVQATYKIQQVYVDQIPEIVLYYRNEARGVERRSSTTS